MRESKVDYIPTKNDVTIMSTCLKHGCKVYPIFKPGQSWTKYNPLIQLACSYGGTEHILIEKVFKQSYLGYYTYLFYHKIYNKKIKPIRQKKEPSQRKLSFPPPPPKTDCPPPPPSF